MGSVDYLKVFTSERRQANERVNGLWLSNEGGGALSFLSQPFVNIVHKGQISTGTWVIEATEYKNEVGSDLQDHLEVTMASRGHQNGYFSQHAHGYQGKRGCRIQI